MARDSGGTWSAPTGNPVVNGTAGTATWANTTVNDLGGEITDSLSRSGKGGMTAALKLANGTVGAPAVAFTNDAAVGIYRKSSGVAGIAAGSADVATWSSSGFKIATLDPASIGMPFIIRKTADQSTTSNTMANVTDLSFSVAASGLYIVEGALFTTLAGVTSGAIDFTGPASPTLVRGDGVYTDNTHALRHMNPGISAFSSAVTFITSASGSVSHYPMTLTLVIENGTNAGTVQLRFRNLDNATTLTIYKHSFLRVTRLV